jgi:hypothetical protein
MYWVNNKSDNFDEARTGFIVERDVRIDRNSDGYISQLFLWCENALRFRDLQSGPGLWTRISLIYGTGTDKNNFADPYFDH